MRNRPATKVHCPAIQTISKGHLWQSGYSGCSPSCFLRCSLCSASTASASANSPSLRRKNDPRPLGRHGRSAGKPFEHWLHLFCGGVATDCEVGEERLLYTRGGEGTTFTPRRLPRAAFEWRVAWYGVQGRRRYCIASGSPRASGRWRSACHPPRPGQSEPASQHPPLWK